MNWNQRRQGEAVRTMACPQRLQRPRPGPACRKGVQPGLHTDGFTQLHHLRGRAGRKQGLTFLIIQARQQQQIAVEWLRAQGRWAMALNDAAMPLRGRHALELLLKRRGRMEQITGFQGHDPEHGRLDATPAQIGQRRQRRDQLRGTNNNRASHNPGLDADMTSE